MNIIFIAAAALIIVFGVIGARSASDKPDEVLSQATESPEPIVSPVVTQTEAPTPKAPTPVDTKLPEPEQTPTHTQAPGNYADWVYPGAITVESGAKLVLSSSASPDEITDWYKNKVSSGYNIQNSVKTSANDVVKNVIQAANGETSVNIEITKNPQDSSTRIEVEIN